jgi:hypothetical protein
MLLERKYRTIFYCRYIMDKVSPWRMAFSFDVFSWTIFIKLFLDDPLYSLFFHNDMQIFFLIVLFQMEILLVEPLN